MKDRHHCKSCDIQFLSEVTMLPAVEVRDSSYPAFRLSYAVCPNCRRVILDVAFGQIINNMFQVSSYALKDLAAPSARGAPADVPAAIAADYNEAAAVRSLSAKASAALSRRCLQHILGERGYSQHDLVKQIEAVLAERDPARSVPETLRMSLDAVRNFGNFSAHPVTDRTTLQIIDVEPGEADWCLEILDECFEWFYVRPAKAEERKRALNEKLAKVGKSPAK